MNLSLIQALETTTYCTRYCSWCLNKNLPSKHMTDEIFMKSISVLEQFPPTLIAMNGCGEPLMDPDIVTRVQFVAYLEYKSRIITNGDLLTPSLLKALLAVGMHSIMLSPHSDISELDRLKHIAGEKLITGYSPVKGGRTHNWAGQLDIPNELKASCNPLTKGRGYINVDGYITQCCLDYRALYPIAHITDDNLPEKECLPIPLCDTCEGSP